MNEEKRGFSARHSLSITLGLGLTGVAVWVIQLARWGEPVGYMLITAAIILVSVGVIGFIIGFILRQVAKGQSQPPRSQADAQGHSGHAAAAGRRQQTAAPIGRKPGRIRLACLPPGGGASARPVAADTGGPYYQHRRV